MAKPIITQTVIRGQLMFIVGNVAVSNLKTAVCAWSAIDALIERRYACLAIMNANAGAPMAPGDAFSKASREEAQLAAEIRHLRVRGIA